MSDPTSTPGAGAPNPEVTTTKAAAAVLGYAPRTLRLWRAKGVIGPPPWTEQYLKDVAAARKGRSALSQATDVDPEPLTLDAKRRIRAAYSDWLGSAATINQICQEEGITRAQFADFKRAEGFVHASEPFIVADLAALPEEDLVDEALDMARSSLARKAAKARHKDVMEAAAKWHDFERQAVALADTLASRLPEALRGAGRDVGPADLGTMNASGHCLVVHPTDLHYGKRGSALLGPGAYDRATARSRLFAALGDLWSYLPTCPEKVILFTGSDGCHIDSAKGTTTKGTPQDMDGNPYEIVVGYTRLMYDLVAWILSQDVHEVEIRTCPGNHDKMVSRIIHASMQCAFLDHPRVRVASSMAEYQVFTWGTTAVLTHHGDGRSSTADLAQVFATQFPREWAMATACRLVLRGNLHHVVDEEAAGVRNLLLPSLSGRDGHHALKWPVGGLPAMRVPLLHRDRGLVALYEPKAAVD